LADFLQMDLQELMEKWQYSMEEPDQEIETEDETY